MQKCVVVITLLLFTLSCTNKREDEKIDQRIHRIENSLTEQRIFNLEEGKIEFELMDSMFIPSISQLDNLKTLAERMEHYGVPGVSIAVINNYNIEWAKGYGIMDINLLWPLGFVRNKA